MLSKRFTGPRAAARRDSSTTHYFLPSPLCRDWCFLCLPRKPSGRPSFLLPYARRCKIFLEPFCQLRNLFQCASIAAASFFRAHRSQARSTMLFAVASCFNDSAASAMCLFLERAKITFLAFTMWVHLVSALRSSGSPNSIASHAINDSLSSRQTTGRGAWPRGAVALLRRLARRRRVAVGHVAGHCVAARSGCSGSVWERCVLKRCGV